MQNEHDTTDDDTVQPEEHRGRRGGGWGRRGRGGPPRRGPHGHGKRGRGGPGRQRARRGATAAGVLLVLQDQAPLHGYDLINELETRSEGRWRPSPGSMYPSLARLEDEGLIVGTDTDDDKRTYELTDAGRERLAKRDPDAPLPWDDTPDDSGSGLRPLAAEVGSQIRQIAKFGSAEQRAAATEVLTETKTRLYAILAS